MATRAAVIEEMIAQRVVAAGIRLRYDKVALRLLVGVKASVAQALPASQSIAFTVTAPIKLPAKTSAALEQWLHRLPTHGLSTTINGNTIRARIINHTAKDIQRVIGFVHNAESNAELALDIAERSVREL